MKSSLVSATSLIALLAFDSDVARAATMTLSANPLNIYDLVGDGVASSSFTEVVTVTAQNRGNTLSFGAVATPSTIWGGNTAVSATTFIGSTGSVSTSRTYTYQAANTASSDTRTVTIIDNAAGTANDLTATLTLSGKGVAPVAGIAGGNAGYTLVTSSNTVAATVTNSGNGNLSGKGTLSNLRGTVGTAGSSAFVGAGATLTNVVNTTGLLDTSSQTINYLFTPTQTGTATTTVVGVFANGAASTNGGTSITATLTGTGVAPVNAVTSGSTFVRLGTSGTATVSIGNIGNGNLSGLGTISNLRGTIATSAGAAFTADPGNPTVLGAGGSGLADAASTTLGFTYTPVSRVAQTSTATISFVNGDTSGKNTAQTVTATVSAQGVGPTYASQLNAVTNTPTAGAAGATIAATSSIPFGSLSSLTSQTVYLAIQNTTTDSDGGNAALTNLTLNDFSIWGANAASFSVGLPDGQVVSKGGQIYLPITVASGTALGLLTANLTVYSDEFSSLGGIGNTFTYALVATNIFEPASLAVLGAGLAGLAGVRRRRKTLPTA